MDLLNFSFERPLIMGIVNVTPDSFSDGGHFFDAEKAAAHGRKLIADGADILDIGGESTRPGSDPVSAEVELLRVLPVIKMLNSLGLALSIDTQKAVVAEAALKAGAGIVNDVSSLCDPAMASVVATHHAHLILMHMRGEPKTMQEGPLHYDDVVEEVGRYLRQARDKAVHAGVAAAKIWLDPGIGFGKTLSHNIALTHGLKQLKNLGHPLVYGASRKRFLGEITGRTLPEDRDFATAVACIEAVKNGAQILRVHNVAIVRDALRTHQSFQRELI